MSYLGVSLYAIDGLFFFYRSLQIVWIARFKKRIRPCYLFENDREKVLKHTYPFLINLRYFFSVGFQSKTCHIHLEGFGLAKNSHGEKCPILTGKEYCLFGENFS